MNIKSKKRQPKPPRRSKYPFARMDKGGYVKLFFLDADDAVRARTAVHATSFRIKGRQYITDITVIGNRVRLEIWRVK